MIGVCLNEVYHLEGERRNISYVLGYLLIKAYCAYCQELTGLIERIPLLLEMYQDSNYAFVCVLGEIKS